MNRIDRGTDVVVVRSSVGCTVSLRGQISEIVIVFGPLTLISVGMGCPPASFAIIYIRFLVLTILSLISVLVSRIMSVSPIVAEWGLLPSGRWGLALTRTQQVVTPPVASRAGTPSTSGLMSCNVSCELVFLALE